jgi:hypothetical protein
VQRTQQRVDGGSDLGVSGRQELREHAEEHNNTLALVVASVVVLCGQRRLDAIAQEVLRYHTHPPSCYRAA